MLKTVLLYLLVLCTCAGAGLCVCSCSHVGQKDNEVARSGNPTEKESAQSCADKACAELQLKDGDIIVVYDSEILVAACFTYKDGKAEYMYDGDYKGSYERLTCVEQTDYDAWSVAVYRADNSKQTPVADTDTEKLAYDIFEEYTEKYGALRAGSYICIFTSDAVDYQFVTLTNGSLEYLDRNDVRYDAWQSSDQADNYWGKLIHDDPEGLSWVVFEYDTYCSKAFAAIADAVDAVMAVRELPDGSVFVYSGKDGDVAMRCFSDGAIYYVQPKDLDDIIRSAERTDLSQIEDAPKNVVLYIPNQEG